MHRLAPADSYQDLGELHDLFMLEPWERLRPVLTTAFSGLAPTDLVIDLGAGTGMGTRVLAGETTARIAALEPSRTMRAVLTARVVDDAELARRVTVRAGRLPGALDDVTAPISGFVAAHLLGHLTADERSATFARLGALLDPDAVGVVTVDPGEDRQSRDEPVEQVCQIGELTYVARYLPTGHPDGYDSEYEVRDGGTVLRREHFAGSWEQVTADDLRRELVGTGLAVEPVTPGVVLVRQEAAR